MMLEEIVEGVAEAAYAVALDHRIVCWNGGARRLLGWTAEEVVGRPCHEVLRGRDDYGNRFCGESCSITRMALCREPLHAFSITVSTASGGSCPVRVSIVPLPGEGRSPRTLLHLVAPLRVHHGASAQSDSMPLDPRPEPSPPSERPHVRPKDDTPLTRRETQLLQLLWQGWTTSTMATELGVSPETIRTHVRNTLNKLAAHNRLEAVATALRRGLI